MKTQAKALEQAVIFETQLQILAENLANILERPASRRSRTELEQAWSEINSFRPKLAVLVRLFRKIEKPKAAQFKRKEYLPLLKKYQQARAVRYRFREWEFVEHMVNRHLTPDKAPLLPKQPDTAQDALITQLYKALHRLANPLAQDPDALDRGCFADIAFPIQSFDLLMAAAYRVSLALNPTNRPRFLDVGCGGGTKVMTAMRFFPNADGLEYDLGYADSARNTLKTTGAGDSEIIHTDAVSFDGYANYGVIYFYRPLQDDSELEKLEQRIINTVRPGTILVAPYDTSLNPRTGFGCANVDGPIFVTGMQQTAADQLKLDAEHTGTKFVNRKEKRKFDTGYWAPILNAASFTGNE